MLKKLNKETFIKSISSIILKLKSYELFLIKAEEVFCKRIVWRKLVVN